MLNLLGDGFQFLDIYSRVQSGRPSRYPLAVYLELTKRCNYKCQFCDLWKVESHNELTFKELQKFIHDCTDIGVKLLHVEGGEATLLPYFIDFIGEAQKSGLHVSLTTNGSTLTDAFAQKLFGAGLQTLAVSIDSHIPEVHDTLRGVPGAFHRAVQNIKNIRKQFPHITVWINHIVHRKNYTVLTEFVNFCLDIDIHSVYLLPIHNLPPINDPSNPPNPLYFTSKEDIENLRIEMKRIVRYMKKKGLHTLSDTFYEYVADSYQKTLPKGYCDEGRLVCEIDATGDVYLCIPNKEVIGNIKRESLGALWSSERATIVRKKMKNCTFCWYNCHIEPTIRFLPEYFLLHPFKMFKDYKMHLG